MKRRPRPGPFLGGADRRSERVGVAGVRDLDDRLDHELAVGECGRRVRVARRPDDGQDERIGESTHLRAFLPGAPGNREMPGSERERTQAQCQRGPASTALATPFGSIPATDKVLVIGSPALHASLGDNPDGDLFQSRISGHRYTAWTLAQRS